MLDYDHFVVGSRLRWCLRWGGIVLSGLLRASIPYNVLAAFKMVFVVGRDRSDWTGVL